MLWQDKMKPAHVLLAVWAGCHQLIAQLALSLAVALPSKHV